MESKPPLWAEKKRLICYDLVPEGKRLAILQDLESKRNETYARHILAELLRRIEQAGSYKPQVAGGSQLEFSRFMHVEKFH